MLASLFNGFRGLLLLLLLRILIVGLSNLLEGVDVFILAYLLRGFRGLLSICDLSLTACSSALLLLQLLRVNEYWLTGCDSLLILLLLRVNEF